MRPGIISALCVTCLISIGILPTKVTGRSLSADGMPHPSAQQILVRARTEARSMGTAHSSLHLLLTATNTAVVRIGTITIHIRHLVVARSDFFARLPQRERVTYTVTDSERVSSGSQRGKWSSSSQSGRQVVSATRVALKRSAGGWTCAAMTSLHGLPFVPSALYRPNFIFSANRSWIQGVRFVGRSFTFGRSTWFIQIRYHHDIANISAAGIVTINAFIDRRDYRLVRIGMDQSYWTADHTMRNHVQFGERFGRYGEPLKIKLPCA